MNLKEYIKKYFARFPNKQHLILKGNTESLLFKEKVVYEVMESNSKANDFNKKPIYDKNHDKNVYILISYNKDNYLNYEILYNYHYASLKSNNQRKMQLLASKPVSQNMTSEKPIKIYEDSEPIRQNLYLEKPMKDDENSKPIKITEYSEKPEQDMLNKPVVIDNKIKQVGVGILENNQLNLYSGTMEISICKLYLEKGNFILTRHNNLRMFDRNIKIIEHGKFEVISHKLFEG